MDDSTYASLSSLSRDYCLLLDDSSFSRRPDGLLTGLWPVVWVIIEQAPLQIHGVEESEEGADHWQATLSLQKACAVRISTAQTVHIIVGPFIRSVSL